ncbi:MAG: SOS response-associated peptidase family protein [Burkholderiales bacterium]|nr:SOS response-associated peptidase family protein [Burkholderiales bacterium]
MCNLYSPVGPQKISMAYAVAAPVGEYAATVAPLKPGPIVVPGRAIVAQWGMIPPHTHSRIPTLPNGQRMSTNNARRERMASAPTYRAAWRMGQRCIIPAESFDEPYWGTGKNIWWRFWRVDGEPWALAGLWSEWVDPQTGEVVPSYTMITQNCDGHPLLGLMHKPDPKLPPDQQDKRTVVSLEREDWEQWLHGSPEQAQDLIRVPELELFKHAAADPAKQLDLLL